MGSAFFSGSEIAYTSLNKLKIKKESEDPKGVMKVVLYIYNHYDRALSTILIGNNLVNIASSAVSTLIVIGLLEGTEWAAWASAISTFQC